MRWQILASGGMKVIAWTGTPVIDDPQLTSKVVFSRVKQALLVEHGFGRDAACTTCDLSLITRSDFSPAPGAISSSEEESESLSDDDEES